MIYIETDSTTPAVNLAYEEYFLKGAALEQDLFMLWQNEPAVVVGRFQNTLEEIDAAFAAAHQIQVIRRISGGGAVYHDLGNLCFSFILHDIQPKILDKSKYARPLVEALRRLGVDAAVSGRSDLMVGGRKFSGSAMALHKDRLLFHGTLLFDTDLEVLAAVLRGRGSGILSKAVKSVRSGVTNLKGYLRQPMDVIQFKRSLRELLSAARPAPAYIPRPEDLDAIRKLAAAKYETWNWNFANDPGCRIHRSCLLMDGVVELDLELEKGQIQSCRITSNSGRSAALGKIANRLIHVRFTPADMLGALAGLEIEEHPGSISREGLVQWIVNGSEDPAAAPRVPEGGML